MSFSRPRPVVCVSVSFSVELRCSNVHPVIPIDPMVLLFIVDCNNSWQSWTRCINSFFFYPRPPLQTDLGRLRPPAPKTRRACHWIFLVRLNHFLRGEEASQWDGYSPSLLSFRFSVALNPGAVRCRLLVWIEFTDLLQFYCKNLLVYCTMYSKKWMLTICTFFFPPVIFDTKKKWDFSRNEPPSVTFTVRVCVE